MSGLESEPSLDRRPRPKPDSTSQAFWDAAARRRLVLRRCLRCRMLQYPPDVSCVHCQGEQFENSETSGLGAIYSYAIVSRPFHAGFSEAVPYTVALVELKDQAELRLITNIIGLDPEEKPYCGMAVQVDYEPRGSMTLPQFRPRGSEQ